MTIAEIHEAFYKADKRRSASTSDGRNIPRIAEEAKRKIKVMVDEYWSMKDKKVRLLLTNPSVLYCYRADLVKTVTGSCRMYQRTSCQIFW